MLGLGRHGACLSTGPGIFVVACEGSLGDVGVLFARCSWCHFRIML